MSARVQPVSFDYPRQDLPNFRINFMAMVILFKNLHFFNVFPSV